MPRHFLSQKTMSRLAFYDTKSYDREFFESTLTEFPDLKVDFHDFRLSTRTALTANDCFAVCCFVNDQLDRPCLTALHDQGVRLIALRCAGFNNLDLEAARELGLTVVRVPAYSPHAVAEHAVALLLTANRKTHRAYARVRDHNFSLQGLVGFDLHGRTASVIGTGQIGRILAQILRGFGMEVLAYDISPDLPWAENHQITYVSLDEALKRGDVVSLHTPLTPETHHLINARALDLMKSQAVLINTGRGKLIDTHALIQVLKKGKFRAVALDVYEEEEGVFFEDLSGVVLDNDELARLITFPNVLITAHLGFLTQEALAEISRVTTENLTRFLAQQAPLESTQLSPVLG